MATALSKDLKREVMIKEKAYTVTFNPQGLKLVEKGRRNGIELKWEDLVSGDTALSSALNASVNRGT